MSISQDSATTIVCREVFDETSHPSNEEVLEYARRLGIDPDAEPHLLDLAREGLMAALPKGWRPCFHEASGAWYYYQASTGTTTWEHPLDAVYKELVEQARAGNTRQMSVEEDSKTTAKDLESHEEATLPKESSFSKEGNKATKTSAPPPTRIPTKLTPLKKPDKADGARKKDNQSLEKLHWKLDTPLATDRAARDYTNLRFQDPRFYECPKLLENVQSTATATTAVTSATTSETIASPVNELDLKEVLKRSESLSPRHEKDWEQLSSKFSSEENIIDIDKLSITTLARSEKADKFDKEKHPSQFGQQKELTLSGGGTMFLKRNRSRDTTPSQEGSKLDDFRSVTIADVIVNVVGESLKSILREKQSEDGERDERPVDEERKSVRFDIGKEVDIKFTYSGSEDDWESESEEQNVRISTTISNKVGSVMPLQKSNSQSFDDENKEDSESKLEEDTRKSSSSEKIEPAKKSGKIVGKRFVVQNVSETEHRNQMARESVSRESSLDYVPTGKFDNVKNIDLVSKSETDCSVAKSSDSDEFWRHKPKKSAIRFSKDRQTDDDDTSDFSRVNQQLSQREEKNLNELRTKLSNNYEKEIDSLKKEFDDQLEQTKKKLEENFLEQKKQLEKNLNDKLEDLKREMAEKEEREIQRLIAEMNEARSENLKKVRAELEVCYEKEKQEILANLKTELFERKRELLQLRNQEMGKLENEYERDLSEEKLAKLSELELTKQHAERIEMLKKVLEKEFDELRAELRAQQREKITKVTENHEKCLAEILRNFRIDEGVTRKMYKQRLEEIRNDLTRDTEKEARKQTERIAQQESSAVDIEKMRSENRLLQDKYTALKEKYWKLKNDVRGLVVERRNRREAGYTTTSETERSTSTRTRTDGTESSEQNTPVRNTRSSPARTTTKIHEAQAGSGQSSSHREPEDSHPQKANSGFQKAASAIASTTTAVAKSAARFESDDTTTASETNANMMKKKKNFSKKTTTGARASSSANANNNNPENPVENIRKQLEKLEDLGDQLPSNETAYTLRYPFQDKAPANASSELEFFRHRIHVERDSVRRAQMALKHQENAFQGRQRAWKQRSARATLEQLVQLAKRREITSADRFSGGTGTVGHGSEFAPHQKPSG
ncbi:centrosomal protein 164 isoform X2 [Ptiloglossa arizonensis]|uniref:centrosomal protein 164 isoform X2 n=1 Tax=Ptiloglossa arizonensis TaxID=3350558 RepID=UPI003F9FEF4B